MAKMVSPKSAQLQQFSDGPDAHRLVAPSAALRLPKDERSHGLDNRLDVARQALALHTGALERVCILGSEQCSGHWKSPVQRRIEQVVG